MRLTGGPLKQAQDLDARYLLSLEPDRMLALYRKRAGLEPKAPPYGGWDADGRNLTGHIAGHYLSAVSLMWAATGDERFKDRANYIVSELKLVQDKQGDGLVSALAGLREAFAEVSKGEIRSAPFDLNGLWSPWYTLHKTFAGLRDAYRYTGNHTALEVEIKFAGWAERILAPMDDGQIQRMLNTEFGGMNEVLVELYADTGDRRWLDLSYRFEHRAVLGPLAQGGDPLNGLHANTQVPKVLGSAVRFGLAGKKEDGVAARTFWNVVVNHHTFATGGHGKDEYFREPDSLSHIVDGRTDESCNVYNMLKLTRRLFALEPKAEYAEFEERALFNHVLGSIDPEDGAMCYMVPVGRGFRREYQDMSRDFTCCVGTGMENHALLGDGIYFDSGDRLWVNLYAPSNARWESAGLRIAVDTSFPLGSAATLKVTMDAPKTLTISLRRPSWAGAGFRASVNGVLVKDVPPAGSYLEIKRTWKTGDSISLVLPKTLHLEPLRDDPRLAAILWGPLVLAGDLGPQSAGPGDDDDQAPATARPIAPMLVTAGRPVTEWLRPVEGKPGTFRTRGVGKPADVDLMPFYRLHRRAYAAYWDILTPDQYQAKAAAIAAERERQRKLDAATVASVVFADTVSEKKFDQQGEGASIVLADGRPGRRAAKWLSYELPVDASKPVVLVATYNSDTRRSRAFEVLVEGQRMGEQRLEPSSVSRFFDVEYPIPQSLSRGKDKIVVRFQAEPGSEVAPVFGLRTIRPS